MIEKAWEKHNRRNKKGETERKKMGEKRKETNNENKLKIKSDESNGRR